MTGDENHAVTPGTGKAVAPSSRDFFDKSRAGEERRELSPTKVIAGVIRGVFDLDVDAIENFYHLVSQRVSDQATCIDEKTEVVAYFSNGKSRRLTSFEEFKAYSQVDGAVPVVVNLGLSFGIQFSETGPIELQNVDIVLFSSDIIEDTVQLNPNGDRVRFASDKTQIGALVNNSNLGVISYTIEHSRISWGLDVENLIQAHVGRILKKETRVDRFLKFSRGPLHLFSTLVIGLFLATQGIDGLFWFLYETEGAPDGATVLDVAASWLTNGHIAKYIVMSAVIAMVLIMLTSLTVRFLLKNIHKPRPSFILISENDLERRKQKLKEHNSRWTKIAGLVVVNIITIALIALFEDRVIFFAHQAIQKAPVEEVAK